jgi:hypothetical protein
MDPIMDEDGWVRIDSEEVALSFIGKRVLVDAPVISGWRVARAHETERVVEGADGHDLWFERDEMGEATLGWRERGNVRLRLVLT